MSTEPEKWKWVDEDPIEKLLQPSRNRAERKASAPSRAEPFMEEGAAQFEQRRYEEAAGCYSAAAAAEPNHPTAHFDLAVCLEKLGRWETAADSFRQALEIDPGRLQALIGFGACLLHLESAAQALTCFERCLIAGSHRDAALFGKAVALHQIGRYEDADRTYRELLQLYPSSVELLANVIALSVTRQDLAAVGEYSRRLLKLNPQSKTALQGLATSAIHKGDQTAALEFCTRLVEIDPESFEGWFNLRFAQQKMRPPEPKQATRSIA